jgi:choline dehydrogenase-like flavoprotein
MNIADVIVVGSGATGSMAAKTLVEGGARVLMIDGGQRDERYAPLIPDKSFVDIRRTEPQQHRYFLGDEFESARFDELTTGAQLTPPRRFIVAQTERLLARGPSNFVPMESLAYGGLGSGWGLNCGVYSDAELVRASLPVDAMRDAYQRVADRIGISGLADDAQQYTSAHLEGVQPPVPLDPTMAGIAERYARRRTTLNEKGYRLGRPVLAMLTRDREGRRATGMQDMDFYSDRGGSAWRPWIIVDELRRSDRFEYAGELLVTRFEERSECVDVVCVDVRTLAERRFSCRRLVLSSGVLGTARIVLRSLAKPGTHLPLLCNPYTYVPCIVPSRIGGKVPDRNTGLVQLELFHDEAGDHRDVAVATLFSYRSLLLLRLMREMPLGVRDARRLMRYLLPSFAIVGIDHPQSPSAGKELWLESDDSSPTHDRLGITFDPTPQERDRCDERERGFMRVLRRLGAWPIKRIRPPLGSSIHYAGTLPFSAGEKPFSLSPEGRLHGSRNVFVADGSGFTFLPAKGLTLSLMANAHIVARGIAANET